MADYKTGDRLVDEKIEEWLKWDKNEKTLKEIKSLAEKKDIEKLRKLLLTRLNFGTAGLRGKMGPGFSALNDLVIVQTGQGVLKYLEILDLNTLCSNGIVIGYDGRHNSKRFAELTATIFLNQGYPVRIFSEVVPTPFIPYAVTKYKSILGIMVTASHNPKEDNGYKVYASNGCQIISPEDINIQNQIMKNLEPLEDSWNISILEIHQMKIDPLNEVFDSYQEMLTNNVLKEHLDNNRQSQLQFVYTPVHGVAYNYFQKIIDNIGLKIIPCEEQKDPDPDFPTVKFPNPEEGPDVFALSMATADRNGLTIVVANDPDADRMSCAEKDEDTGKWKIFTGNEIGALLGWWALECYKQDEANSVPLKDIYMVASTVSSKILRTIARDEGFNFIETLTGFKWIGNKIYELRNNGKKTIFAFEEAIGFLWGEAVLDKDGVQAGAQLGTMAAYLKTNGLTINDQLERIFDKYGYHLSLNSYFLCYDKLIINQIFERLRNYGESDSCKCKTNAGGKPTRYPKHLAHGKWTIIDVRDLTTGYDSSEPDRKTVLPVQSDSQMITFTFANGLVLTLRTSGTEPKIKYYTEMIAKPDQCNRQEIQELLVEMVHRMIHDFLQPKKNGLVLPPK